MVINPIPTNNINAGSEVRLDDTKFAIVCLSNCVADLKSVMYADSMPKPTGSVAATTSNDAINFINFPNNDYVKAEVPILHSIPSFNDIKKPSYFYPTMNELSFRLLLPIISAYLSGFRFGILFLQY